MLLEWTKEIFRRMDSIENNTAAELVKNSDDGNNKIFPFYKNSDEGSKFKKSKQRELISNLPKFLELVMRNSFENIDCIAYVAKSMAGTIEILLKVVSAKSIPKHLKKSLISVGTTQTY